MNSAGDRPNAPLTGDAGKSKNQADSRFVPEIIVRNPRFHRNGALSHAWLSPNPVATAWFTALSASFPRGEAYFIESIRNANETLPPALARDVAAFIAQEANHAREHTLFNRLAAQAGHDLSAIDARLAAFIAQTSQTSPFVNLLITACLEHFTAIIARDLLTHPDLLADASPETAALWRWHALEEIEHKAVAYDLWMHIARHLSRRQRYKIRCKLMLKVSAAFLLHRSRDARELLEQQGMSPKQARRALRAYLWSKGGPLRRILPAWAQWLRPGFHPWDQDDRALLLSEAQRAAA
jgi:predicted metal-dependent hydrolase